MHLTRLALTDFRSYSSADVALRPGVTLVSGPNGEGKTNLVEAVGYVATLASHRSAHDAPLVRQGADRAIIRANVHGATNDALVEIELNPGRANRVRLNRAPLTRPREVLGVRHQGGEPVPATRVQLGEHVVKDQHRVLPPGSQQVEAGQPQRQRQRPGLAVAGVTPGGQLADLEI